jgi:hypothetical protein
MSMRLSRSAAAQLGNADGDLLLSGLLAEDSVRRLVTHGSGTSGEKFPYLCIWPSDCSCGRCETRKMYLRCNALQFVRACAFKSRGESRGFVHEILNSSKRASLHWCMCGPCSRAAWTAKAKSSGGGGSALSGEPAKRAASKCSFGVRPVGTALAGGLMPVDSLVCIPSTKKFALCAHCTGASGGTLMHCKPRARLSCR